MHFAFQAYLTLIPLVNIKSFSRCPLAGRHFEVALGMLLPPLPLVTDSFPFLSHFLSLQGQTRMSTVVHGLLLRRTKATKSAETGAEIVQLPPKREEEHRIKLTEEEKRVYDEVFSFSQVRGGRKTWTVSRLQNFASTL